MSAGDSHSVALAKNGTAYAWGSNRYGQLGDDKFTNSSVPVRVEMPAGATVTQVSAGDSHSVALAKNGTAYAWGSNYFGQRGDGKTRDSSVPVRVEMPAEVTVTQVSAAYSHSVAVLADGTAYAWGYNNYGQRGDGKTRDSSVPVRVQMPAEVTFTQMSAGSGHSLAVTADGTAYAWGHNNYGQLGDGRRVDRETPVPVLTLTTVTGVSFGGDSATNLVDNDDGSWTATTPPHAAGPVDVVVSWARNDVAQPDIRYADAFTYVVPDVAPTVTDPEDQEVTAGDAAMFTVEATGTPEPGVSWEFSADDGSAWSAVGAADGTVSSDGKTLTVTTTEALSGFQYRATAENTVGVVTSAAATLTVTAAPVAPTVADPEDQAVTAGDAATFTVETTGTPEPSLLWEYSTDDGSTWSAVTATDGTVRDDGKTLTVTATEALSGTQYRATAENTVGAVTSNAATLTVSAVPVAPTVTDPADQAVTAGDAATFTVEATGTPEPGVTWEFSTDDGVTWSAVGAADGTVSGDGKTLTVAATEALSGTLYRVTAENSVDAVTSEAATLTVAAVPVAPTVTDPADQVVTAGDAAMFTVETTGTPVPSLLWEYSTDDGATWGPVGAADGTVSGDGKTLTVAATEALSGVLYRVTAENSVDAVTSEAATLTVTAVPVAPTVTDPEDQVVTAGDAAMFTVEATGTPEPSLLWEFSTDDGVTWGPVGTADGTVSGDGKTLTVAATEALSGTQYRVTAENSVDAVTSAPATLTVSAAPVIPPVTDPVAPPVTDSVGETDLARTGSDPVPAIAVAVLFALIGAGLLLASRRKHA
ncbi:RCC1 domain-containing protein [Microbacterium sp. A588]